MNSKRNVYLDMKSIEEAKKILFDHFEHMVTKVETLDVVDAKGRVLATPAMAVISSPNFHAAAMDGIAVDAATTFGASEETPSTLCPDKNAFWINTGHAMPEGTNAVIMIEHLNIIDEKNVEIEAPVFPWQHVRKMGEDIVATQLLFPQGHRINAHSLGALLSGGIFTISAYKKPKVLIIPTGSELKQWHEIKIDQLKPGDVVESNSSVLGGLCEDHGAQFESHSMLRDNLENIKRAVENAAKQDYDMICIIGGSSAGSEDFAKQVITSLGKIYVHGVTMMPGKPMMFGKVFDTPVFGIPGYPVAAIVAFEQFAGPLLLNMQKLPKKEIISVHVSPARKIASKLGLEEFLRVKIGSVDGKLISSQLPRGSGSITTLTEADGIIRIPANIEGISANQKVRAQLLRPLSSIENTIVITGSHDNTLDILADQIKEVSCDISVSSSHVGSMGGLMAIKKGACHMAGAHLLDPEDGSYNISYIKKYLPNQKVWIINLVMRDQGLIVAKTNPKNIQSIQDLKDKGLKFINRQPGSGTRILFDYKLKSLGLSIHDIQGYENDEYTHMSVAVSVLSGRVDAGLGIHAAARALDLDFIPIVTEEYDLIIPDRFYKTPKIQTLLKIIQTEKFKDRIQSLGGYGTQKTGKIIYS
ncbi:MAG: molybdopterin biosynthesis protein [Desulfobacula sp.]|jgi:putative molybdopterin biosynthesis protein|uniref:molybdopterin biosynthesis protein n=1 Tax=Desulfobacula sp. TaxID=2593537 RepID=UPI001D3C3F92|nr:molybdopterin biosynthesis protein [Desulfobacula sp.]MBT3486339.1 molybdopterin biosynthesis protein [Desulfobacula sp.]MBT3805896.1 molybdopterin biosynthesis protein [Desulfobacula sp.]MBT4026322.1 molybdopterin biosynthesis protein [Desulfobacula sp.]MBT4198060.1 molybdopterin biosynthesis protein [Desulfobacula sp.]